MKPGLFQLNRDTVKKCPLSGLASGVYIENSILFLPLIVHLKASVPTVVSTFLRIAGFVFFDTAMMQWKRSFVPVTSAGKWRLLIWAYVALVFCLQNFVDFPTKSICLVVMKFCLVLSVLLLLKPTSWVCLATLGALKTTDYLWLHLEGFILLLTKPATLKQPALLFKYEWVILLLSPMPVTHKGKFKSLLTL